MTEKEFSEKARMLGKEIPRSLKREGVKSYNPLAEQKHTFERMANTGVFRGRKVRRELRDKAAQILASGVLNKEVEYIDKRVANRIDRDMEGVIRAKVQRGEFSLEEVKRSYHQFMGSRKK